MISENQYINITFSFFICFTVFLYYNKLLFDKVDYIAFYLSIIICLFQIFTKNIKLLDLTHFLYCFVYLFLVTFISKNKYLLGLNLLMIFNIILSRYYYEGCVLNRKQKKLGFFTKLNKKIWKYTKLWDWSFIFIILFIISIYRFF